MHVLLIEDDDRVAKHIAKGLRELGHHVERSSDGRDGLATASLEQFDAIILDRMLPGLDGLSILAEIRGSGEDTPILLLSALGEVDERVKGLKAGANDYLPKPFALSELIARIEILGRRAPMAAEQTRLQIADLELDLLGLLAQRSGRPIDLTAREFRILEYLVRNAGRVVTRSLLLESVWDYNFDPRPTSSISMSAACAKRLTATSPCR
jgi:two-component system OmpR family response regulator